jgi:hypothetical protein
MREREKKELNNRIYLVWLPIMLLSIYYFLILLFTQSRVFICVGETQFPLFKKKKKKKVNYYCYYF